MRKPSGELWLCPKFSKSSLLFKGLYKIGSQKADRLHLKVIDIRCLRAFRRLTKEALREQRFSTGDE